MHITIGEKIQEILAKKGLKIKDMSNKDKMNGVTFANTFVYKIANTSYDSTDSTTLLKLSKAFNVSTDYLLDISNETSTDVELKDISKKTGLSVKSLSRIISLNNVIGNIDTLNLLFESLEIVDLYLSLTDVFLYGNDKEKLLEDDNGNKYPLSSDEYKELKIKKLINVMIAINENVQKSKTINLKSQIQNMKQEDIEKQEVYNLIQEKQLNTFEIYQKLRSNISKNILVEKTLKNDEEYRKFKEWEKQNDISTLI